MGDSINIDISSVIQHLMSINIGNTVERKIAHCAFSNETHQETQGNKDAGILNNTQSAGGTQRLRQHLWREWAGDVLGRDPSSD